MLGSLDFSMSVFVCLTLVCCAVFPCLLMIIARIPALAGRNALQFLICFINTTLIWLVLLLKYVQTLEYENILTSFFLYGSFMLVYLEIWGLLSRGYTLGLLLTFFKANQPLSAHQVAELYRGGQGLDWLMQHRFSGLISAKMVHLKNNKVTLTTRGCLVAYLYKLSILLFGLRYSG